MQAIHPNVVRLAVHLEKEKQVRFREDASRDEVLHVAAGHSTLEGWFAYNKAAEPTDFARTLTYDNFPEHFRWDISKHVWSSYKRRPRTMPVGRMYAAHPADNERFCLRLLQTQPDMVGCTGYPDMRTYAGVIHPTYHAAALARGLLEGDNEWDACMRDAETVCLPGHLRALFASLLAFCQVAVAGSQNVFV